jgi:hypothetical protein
VNQSELDSVAYDLAKDFLVRSGADKGVTPGLVEKYLHLDKAVRPQTVAGLYERVLESAQSANMGAGVIGGSIGGVHRLGPVLCDFQPTQVLKKYTLGWEGVLDEIEARLQPRGSLRRTPRSIWPRYCRTILFLELGSVATAQARYPEARTDGWRVPFPITAVEVQNKVGGTELASGPRETTLPGYIIIRNSFMSHGSHLPRALADGACHVSGLGP